jgi:hypothetical protein
MFELIVRDNGVEGGSAPTQWWVVLRGANHEVVLSGEMLTRRSSAVEICRHVADLGVVFHDT